MIRGLGVNDGSDCRYVIQKHNLEMLSLSLDVVIELWGWRLGLTAHWQTRVGDSSLPMAPNVIALTLLRQLLHMQNPLHFYVCACRMPFFIQVTVSNLEAMMEACVMLVNDLAAFCVLL